MLASSHFISNPYTAPQGKLDKSSICNQGNQGPGNVNLKRIKVAELGFKLRSTRHQDSMFFLSPLLTLPFLAGWFCLMTRKNKDKSIHILKTMKDRINRIYQPGGPPWQALFPQRKELILSSSCGPHSYPEQSGPGHAGLWFICMPFSPLRLWTTWGKTVLY